MFFPLAGAVGLFWKRLLVEFVLMQGTAIGVFMSLCTLGNFVASCCSRRPGWWAQSKPRDQMLINRNDCRMSDSVRATARYSKWLYASAL